MTEFRLTQISDTHLARRLQKLTDNFHRVAAHIDATRPDLVYRHEWQVGDMVIWDNRGVLHRACRYDPTSPRDMHRTTLYGDEPVQ